MRVDGAPNNLTVILSERFSLVAKIHNLSRADEGEVQGVEEEEQPF